MSRAVIGEYVLTADLVATSALAVGSGEPGPDTDMACLRDGLGRLIIPGSALAGVLRPESRDPVWGDPDAASLTYIEDAPAKGEVRVETRDGVGIDRISGTAAHGVLYAREVVPAGSQFALEIRVEAVQDQAEARTALSQQDAESWITAIAADLAAGRSLGSATSTGLGRVELDPRTAKLEWRGIANRDGLLDVLGGTNPTRSLKITPSGTPGLLLVSIAWNPVSPLLVSVPMNGLVDRLPQTTGIGEHTRLVIPGASIKGALRSRAEKIVRTLIGIAATRDHLDQMAADLGPVQRVFGRPPTGTGQARSKGQRGAATVGEVYSPVIREWAKILDALALRAGAGPKVSAAEKQLQKAKPRASANRLLATTDLRITPHVAISRWTGGADDGKLFATLAPGAWFGRREDPEAWEPITLAIDLSRLGDTEDELLSALRLLTLVLRDLAEGWIGLGHSTSRGYGEITADPTDIRFTFPAGLPEQLTELEGRDVTMDEFLTSHGAELSAAWHQEITALTPPLARVSGAEERQPR